jgi:hypothetical protein
MSNSLPASISAFQTCLPAFEGTLISNDISPEKLIRMTRAGTPAAVAVRQLMNGKASFDRSTSVSTFWITARLFGPTTPKVDQWSVTELI